jgi:hypothetical protein
MAWLQRLRNAFLPNQLQSDIEREVAFHIKERADELREKGLSEEEAIRAARTQFGNVTAQLERTRDMDISEWLEAIVRNLRLGARVLAKTPAFTTTAILTLALGIGANSAVFSAIYAVLLRPLPFPRAEQLVKLLQFQPKSPEGFLAPARLEDWNRFNTTFQAITGYYSEDTTETTGELPEKVKRAWVAPRFLQVMEVAPAVGRDFTFREEHFGGPSAVVISDRFWRRRFGGRPDAIGKTLRVPATSWTIVGVMPAPFQFPDHDVDLWSPSPPDAPYAQSREATWFTAIGPLETRTEPGTRPGQSPRRSGKSWPPVSENRRGDLSVGRAAKGSHCRRCKEISLAPVCLRLPTSYNRVHENRCPAPIEGSSPRA